MISGPVEVYTFLKQKEEWVCNGGENRYIFSKSSYHRRSAETENGAWFLWMASTRSGGAERPCFEITCPRNIHFCWGNEHLLGLSLRSAISNRSKSFARSFIRESNVSEQVITSSRYHNAERKVSPCNTLSINSWNE